MMACERFIGAIQELADGTLGSIRRAELELHMESCDGCRRLADDVIRIRDLAGSLERPAPPDRVWLQIAGRLRQEGRVAAPAVTTGAHRYYPFALAASLLLVVAASLYLLYPRPGSTTRTAGGNAAPADAVQNDVAIGGIEAEFRLAEQHLQNAISKLEQEARSDSSTIDAQTAALLQKNLQVIDEAIAESSAALRSEPQSAPARDSLFDALRRKVMLLQDTIALMNQMRRGDAAGAAQVVEGANKS